MASFYKTIDGVRYDRKLVELAEQFATAKNGQPLGSDHAKELEGIVKDGGRVTKVEHRTIKYILKRHHWKEEAGAALKANYIAPYYNLLEVAEPPNAQIRSLLGIRPDGSIPNNQLLIHKDTLALLDAGGLVAKLILTGFEGKPIRINNAKANNIADGPEVVITGTSGFRLKSGGAPIELTLDIVDGNVQLLVAFTMIDKKPTNRKWVFSDSFDELPTLINVKNPAATPTSPLDDLKLENAKFLLTTREEIVGGQCLLPWIMNFRADMIPTGILSVFETIIGQHATLPLRGTVIVPSAGNQYPALSPFQFPWDQSPTPGISLRIGLGIDPQKIGGAEFQATDFRLYSATSTKWLAKNSTYSTTVAYSGTIKIPSAKIDLPVVASTPPGTQSAKLSINTKDSPLGSLANLLDIIGGDDAASELPATFTGGSLDNLGLQGLSMTFALEGSKVTVTNAEVTVGMPKADWSIWPSTFTVDSVMARFVAKNPFIKAKRELEVILHGQVEILKEPVAIVARKSGEWQITATTKDAFEVPLADLINKYAGTANVQLPPASNLNIDTLQLVVAPKSYYSFMLIMAQKPKPWVLPLGVTDLAFSNVNLFFLKPKGQDLTGSVSATAQFAGVTLKANYDLPGDVMIRGDFPEVKLSEVISFLTGGGLDVAPSGFDLTFIQSYVLLQKVSTDYRLEMGTVVQDLGSMAFVLEKKNEWGFALGLQLSFDQMGKLPGIGHSLDPFLKLIPIDSLTLAVSTLQDSSFTFPGFQTFNQPALGGSGKDITLPAISSGIQKGFYLFSKTTFSRSKGGVIKALMNLLKIAEGTDLEVFFKYLSQASEFQFGFAVSTFLTKKKDSTTDPKSAPYKNSHFSGMIFVTAGGANGFSFNAAAQLQTIIQKQDVEFDVLLSLVENGFFVSGTMKTKRPISFGPFAVGNLALELGISFEGLPSFGFSAELEAAGINSSLAVLVNTENPTESMVAGALSDLSMGDIVSAFLNEVHEPFPAEIKEILDTIAIKGPKEGSFIVPANEGQAFVDSINQYDGNKVSAVFRRNGVTNFPAATPELMIFSDDKDGKYFLTEQPGNSVVTHWQVEKTDAGKVAVSKEAQFYFVPNPAGVSIGTLKYNAGFMVSGAITFLGFEVDVDIIIDRNKGFKADACMTPVSFLGIDQLFSLKADVPKQYPKSSCGSDAGPLLSICTYTQDSLPDGTPEKYKKPHLFLNGKLTMLGSSWGIFADINKDGASLQIDTSILGGAISGSLSGDFSKKGFDIGGNMFVGIPDIDLGPLGKWNIKTGVEAGAKIYAHVDDGTFGAEFSLAVDLIGKHLSVGTLKLNVNTDQIADMATFVFDKVKDFLKALFKDPKVWAEYAAKFLGWAAQKVLGVLKDAFGLAEEAARDIIKVVSGFCPVVTAATAMIK